MPAAAAGVTPGLRWSVPFALLVLEYLALSLFVDFPTSGPAIRAISAARMLVPAVLGGGAAGWIIARRSLACLAGERASPLEPWHPWPALALHLAAFAATAFLALRLFGTGRTVHPGAFVLWLACAAGTVLLALRIAAPASALLRSAKDRLRVPIIATGVGLLTWRAVAAAEGLWGVLQSATLHAVAAVLRIASADVVVDPAERLVGADGFEVVVAPMCSGVDGLGLVLVFQAVWLSFARSRVHLGRALLLLAPAGVAAALAANVLRIAALVLLGASGREDLAMGAFHSKLGWMLFAGIALASVAVAEHVPWVRRRAEGPAAVREAEGVPERAGAYLAPLVAALAVALATSLWATPGFDRLYVLRAAAAVAVLLLVRRSLPAPSFSFSWAPVLAGAAVGAAWILSSTRSGTAPPEALAALGGAERAAWIAARLLGSCLVLPVVEELAFRGFLLPWLVDPQVESVSPRAWTLPAVLLSSLAFGAVHEQWLLGTLGGVAFAAVRLRRGRLGDAMAAHAAANAAIGAAVLFGERWALWS